MIERTGFVVVSEEEYYKEIINEFKIKFPNMSENPSNLLCVLARIMARNENARDYDRVTAYSNAYIATATGDALSKAVYAAGLARISGTKAVGSVRVNKSVTSAQMIIPPKMRIKSNNSTYETLNESALVINGEHEDIQVASINVGSVFNISEGSKFKTILNIHGVGEIVSISEISGGTNIESDLDLRNRYILKMNSYSNSSLKGVVDSVSLVPGVYSVIAKENNTGETFENMPPHSFKVFASGGTDYDIAKSIMDSKPAGIQTCGDVVIDVDVFGTKYPISFSRFSSVEVYFNLKVAIDRSVSEPNFVEKIKNSIVSHVEKSKELVSYEIVNELAQDIEALKGVQNISFGTNPNPSSNSTIIPPVGTNFSISRENIAVEVI